MGLKLPPFLQDKRAQLAIGGGVVLGAVVLIRKKGGTTATSSTSSAPGTGGTLGSYDSSSGDAYNNLNNELQAALDSYQGQLTSIEDQLGKLTPAGGTTSGSGSTSHKPPHPKPPAPHPGAAGPWGWFISKSNRNTPKVVAKRYGLSEAAFLKLNPGLKANSHIKAGQRVKVRAGAGAYAPVKKKR